LFATGTAFNLEGLTFFMKVLCINCNEKSDLKVGEVYTVIDNLFGFFLLKEFNKSGIWFNESQFAPLSDADETDLLIKRKMSQ
jgi:hypothetical protein